MLDIISISWTSCELQKEDRLVASALPETPVAGAQLVGRACMLLREIARHGTAGARLAELTVASGLPHGTVHRILQSLIAESFLFKDTITKHYRLGSGIFELGLVAPSPLDHLSRLRPLLDALADKIGDTAYLMMRRGDEIICMARAEGASPLRAYSIVVGEMRPLAASLSGICMMASMADDEVENIIRRSYNPAGRFPDATPEYVRRQVAHVRRHGYCISREVLMKAATGLSAPVPNPDGPPFLGLSLSAVSSRVPESRVAGLVEDLLASCHAMGAVVRQD
jgi:DNA-binding IclR family transcriptional regulator